jgi:nicotinate-nucleotide--dimethylbenzimidazole phosphoribosyltransferase
VARDQTKSLGVSGEEWFVAPCPPPSQDYAAAAEKRQNALTKPQGALGVLERLAIRLAALQHTDRPRAENAHIILFAGDHGITAQGVSAFPSAVTEQMLSNFASGGAAISVLARELGAPLDVVDVGTLATAVLPGVIVDKLRHGTRDFSIEPAMTIEEVTSALAAGRRAVQRALERKVDILILGEMGIGNTTSAAAIAAALLRQPTINLTGAGTGLDDSRVRNKAAVIAEALRRHSLDQPGVAPIDVLCRVGGLEIAALMGAIICAAQSKVPVLIDGFIVTVAALLAGRLNPSCLPWLIYSHRSAEQGHRRVLEALDAKPIVDLQLRLGEGSGAAVALPIVRLACALHAQMATFDEARVSGRA